MLDFITTNDATNEGDETVGQIEREEWKRAPPEDYDLDRFNF